MTPAARLSAAAEVLDQILSSRAHAETALRSWGAAHRFAGSRDRRAIAQRVYACLRGFARISWTMEASTGRALVLGSLLLTDRLPLGEIEAQFTGEGHGPAPLTEEERAKVTQAPETAPPWVEAGVPAFVAGDLQRTYGKAWAEEARGLVTDRAPLDLRVNGAVTTREQALADLAEAGIAAEPTPWSAWGVRIIADPAPDIGALDAFKRGGFEVQDEASQIVSWLAGVRDGMTVVDYCAGGGGKTLALAQGSPKRLVAYDVDPRRLENIRPRLTRAGVHAELRRLGPKGEGAEALNDRADVVFVDAPCTGSGAWRRHPEGACRITPAEVERFHDLQADILSRAALLVKPGGRLVYVTCSVLGRENEDTLAGFEQAWTDFAPVPIASALITPGLTPEGRARLAQLAGRGHTLRLSPARTATDGFFAAIYERRK